MDGIIHFFALGFFSYFMLHNLWILLVGSSTQKASSEFWFWSFHQYKNRMFKLIYFEMKV